MSESMPLTNRCQREKEAFVSAYLKRDPSASYREMELAWAGVVGSMWQAARSLPPTDAPRVGEPSPGLLMSMAMRYDHALGMPGFYDSELYAATDITHAERLASTLSTMRQLWEEVSGNGFYKPELEEYYSGLARQDAALARHEGEGNG